MSERAEDTASAQQDLQQLDPVRNASRGWRTVWFWYRKQRWAFPLDRALTKAFNFSVISWMFAKVTKGPQLRALLLETIGRRSGRLNQTVLPYWEVDGDLVVLGTVGGGPKDPQWVHNLRATPISWVRLRRRRVPVLAHIADDAERQRLIDAGVWHKSMPLYTQRARSYGRELPFVVLTPRPQPDRPTQTIGKRIFKAADNEKFGPRS